MVCGVHKMCHGSRFHGHGSPLVLTQFDHAVREKTSFSVLFCSMVVPFFFLLLSVFFLFSSHTQRSGQDRSARIRAFTSSCIFSTNCGPPICGLSCRDPPDVVFQRETVSMRAQVRHCDSSLSSRWRNGASRVVCASKHDLLHGAQLFCLVLCHLLKSFFNSVKGPFRSFHIF